MNAVGQNEWLLLEDVARITRAPLSTVRFWCAKGKLQSIRPGRRRMVHRNALARFLERGSNELQRAEP